MGSRGASSDPTRLRLTPTGVGALVVAGCVLLGAWNTANNLLHVMAAVLLALFPTSAWLSSAAVRRVTADLLAPTEVVSGSRVIAAVELSGRGSGLLVEVEAASPVPDGGEAEYHAEAEEG